MNKQIATRAKQLQDEYSGKLPSEISVVWCVEDGQSIAPDLTDYECRLVLQRVKKGHDATVGINWEVLEYYADQVIEERGSR